MISMLFTFAVAIFGLIASSVSKVNDYFGCQTQHTGVLELWNNIDSYLIEVDSAFCGNDCGCQFTNPSLYTSNSTIAPFYSKWNKAGNATNFTECSGVVQTGALNKYLATPGGSVSPIDSNAFASYWRVIEEKFNCTGWCTIYYNDTATNQELAMFKYLFTDINR